MIPLTDASRRPTVFPVVTASIVAINVVVFVVELLGGDAFVERWSLVSHDIVSGRHLETVLTAMFMHASWSHIIGNMIFLWAFSPEIEDAMGPVRYLAFYLGGGLVARVAPDGEIDRIVRLPVSQPTSCALGGPDLRTLYVTTAKQRLSEAALAAEPHAGDLFAIRVETPGIAEPEFQPSGPR